MEAGSDHPGFGLFRRFTYLFPLLQVCFAGRFGERVTVVGHFNSAVDVSTAGNRKNPATDKSKSTDASLANTTDNNIGSHVHHRTRLHRLAKWIRDQFTLRKRQSRRRQRAGRRSTRRRNLLSRLQQQVRPENAQRLFTQPALLRYKSWLPDSCCNSLKTASGIGLSNSVISVTLSLINEQYEGSSLLWKTQRFSPTTSAG